MVLGNIISCVLILVTTIIAFTWKPRAGKILLCLSLLLAFIVSIAGLVLNFLIIYGNQQLLSKSLRFFRLLLYCFLVL